MLNANASVTPMVVGLKLSYEDSELFEDPTLYRSTIGVLHHLTLKRHDICYIVNKLSQYLKAPTKLQWQACKRLLRYIKEALHFGLMFKPSNMITMEAYIYVDWARNVDGQKSTSRYCIFLGKIWCGGVPRQRVVAFSSTNSY